MNPDLKKEWEKYLSETRKHVTVMTKLCQEGWCRELWLKSLGLNAVLPPPKEKRHVKTAIGAAMAEQSAEQAR